MNSSADIADSPLHRSPLQRIGVPFVVISCLLFFLFTQAMVLQKVLYPFSQPQWYKEMQHRDHATIDFFSFYECGYLVNNGLAARVYDPQVQLKYFNDLVYPEKVQGLLYNLYPPYYFFFLIPLAWIPAFNTAYLVWCTLQAVFGLIGSYFLSRVRPDLSAQDRLIMLMIVMSTVSAYLCIWHGSTSFWLLGLHSLYLLFWWRRNDIAAGAFLALSTIKYQYALMMSMPAFADKRWKLIASAAVMELLMIIAGGMTIGWENVRNYPQFLKHAEMDKDVIGINAEYMISIRGPLSNVMPSHDALVVSGVILLLALVPWLLYLRKIFAMTSMGSGSTDAVPASTELPVESQTGLSSESQTGLPGESQTGLPQTGLPSNESPRQKHASATCQNNELARRFALALTVILTLALAPHCHTQDSLLLAIPIILTLPKFSNVLKTEPLSYRLWTAILLTFPLWGWIFNYMIPRKVFFSGIFFINCLLFFLGLRVIRHTLHGPRQTSHERR